MVGGFCGSLPGEVITRVTRDGMWLDEGLAKANAKVIYIYKAA
jgi:hypothetical protein